MGRFKGAFLSLGILFSALLPTHAQKSGTPERAANAWKLASNAGLTMALYEAGGDEALVKKYADITHKVAGEMKIELPRPPEKTGKKAEDSAAVLAFLLKDLTKLFGENLVSGKETALAEIGLKSGALLILYGPGDSSGKSIAKVLTARATKAGLPDDVMADLVEKIEKEAPYEEVRDAVMVMRDAVTASLESGDEKEAPAEPKGSKPKETKGKLSEGSQILENAIGSMTKATGYNIKGGLILAKNKRAELSGAFGLKKMDLITISPDKKEKAHRIVVGAVAVISKDGDKTWAKDTDVDSIKLLSSTVTIPIDASAGVTKEIDFKIVGEEQMGKETVLHLQGNMKDDKGEPVVYDYWIAKDEELTTVVRRCKIPMKFTDMEAIADITYLKINDGDEVEIPEGAGE